MSNGSLSGSSPSETEPVRVQFDLRALRGRKSVAGLTYLFAGVGMFLTTMEAELILPGSSLAAAVLIATMGTGSALLVLFAADLTVLRARTHRTISIALVLVVYLLVGITRAVVSSLSSASLVATVYPEFAARSVAGVLLVVAWLTIIAIVLDFVDKDRRATAELRRQQGLLLAQQEYFAAAVDKGRSQIAALVDAVATPAITRAEQLIATLDADRTIDAGVSAGELDQLANDIRDRAEGEVRSMSHSLELSDDVFDSVSLNPATPLASVESRGAWLRRAVRQSSLLAPIQPTAVTLTVLLEAIPLFAWLFGFRGLVQSAVIGSLLMFSYLSAIKWLLTPRLRYWSAGARVLALLLVVGGAAAVATVTIYFWYPPGLDETIAIFIRSFLVLAVVMGVWAVLAASATQSMVAQRDLAAVVAETRWQVDALSRELAAVRRDAAEIVHGRVQGTLVAAALAISLRARQLRRGIDGDASATRAALDQAAALLAQARAEVESLQERRDLELRGFPELFAAIAQAWAGVVEVRAKVTPLAVRRLEADRATGVLLASVIREAITNAARHGAAQRVEIVVDVDIAIEAATNGAIVATITDDGRGLSKSAVAQSQISASGIEKKANEQNGIGLSRLNTAGIRWSLTPAKPRGATLRIEILREPAVLDGELV